MSGRVDRTGMAIDLVALVGIERLELTAKEGGNDDLAGEYRRRRYDLMRRSPKEIHLLLSWAIYALAFFTRDQPGQERLYRLTLGRDLTSLFDDDEDPEGEPA
jgi:hypothetical protein